MKKKYRMIYVLSLSMLSALISCDSDVTVSQQSGAEGNVTFSAIINSGFQHDTRTYLSGLSTIWNAGDQIKVNGTDISLVNGANTRYGMFRGTVSASSSGYYAGYPTSATTYSDGTMTLAIPANQTHDASNTLLGQMPMAAYAQADANGNVVLNFKNAANILKLNLWGESQTIDRIEISSSVAYLAGTYNVTPSGTDNVTFGNWTGTSKTITLNCPTPIPIGSTSATATPFYILIPKLSGNTLLTIKTYSSTTGLYQQNTITVDGDHNTHLKTNASNYLCATAATKFVPTKIAGALPSLFSVSATKKVYFSQGNLQYLGSGLDGNSSPIWRFAEHQWDCMGGGPSYSNANFRGNVNISGYTADGTGNKGYNNGEANTGAARDLFGWGTSGYNYRGLGETYSYQPYNTVFNSGAYGPSSGNLSGNSDWGYNKISNGGDTENSGWRTLSGGTNSEWYYLLNSRTTSVTINGVSNARYSKVKIEYETGKTINGLLIYPDEFEWTSDMGSAPENTNVNTSGASFSPTYTAAQFQKMEASGVVFLPVSYYRWIAELKDDNIGCGVYWSISRQTDTNSFDLYFGTTVVDAVGSSRDKSSGLSVRLVRDYTGSSADNYAITTW